MREKERGSKKEKKIPLNQIVLEMGRGGGAMRRMV